MAFEQKIRDRYIRCLQELGVELTNTAKQMRPLSRLVVDMAPERRQVLESRASANRERRRRKAADAAADNLRQAIETVLCDDPSHAEMVSILETALNRNSTADILCWEQ